MNREPTVLDYLKSLLRGKPLAIPSPQEAPTIPQPTVEEPQAAPAPLAAEPALETQPKVRAAPVVLPWRSLLALGLALAAQISLQPGPDRTWLPGVILYALAAGSLAWAVWTGEWSAAELPEAIV